MWTSSLSASFVRDIIMEASVNGLLGRLTNTLGGSASSRVRTNCSGLTVLRRISFTRVAASLYFLVLPMQSSELRWRRRIRYPQRSLLEPDTRGTQLHWNTLLLLLHCTKPHVWGGGEKPLNSRCSNIKHQVSDFLELWHWPNFASEEPPEEKITENNVYFWVYFTSPWENSIDIKKR